MQPAACGHHDAAEPPEEGDTPDSESAMSAWAGACLKPPRLLLPEKGEEEEVQPGHSTRTRCPTASCAPGPAPLHPGNQGPPTATLTTSWAQHTHCLSGRDGRHSRGRKHGFDSTCDHRAVQQLSPRGKLATWALCLPEVTQRTTAGPTPSSPLQEACPRPRAGDCCADSLWPHTAAKATHGHSPPS